MRIVVAPVVVGDRICRIVSPIDSLLEVEEWVGEWWEPSSVTLTMASQSPSASTTLLVERGVPLEDRVATEPRPADTEIQALLRAREPAHAGQSPLDGAMSAHAHGHRRKQYAGNARFRRVRPEPDSSSLDRPDLRRVEPPAEWTGPWRRASDIASSGSIDGDVS